MAVSLTAALEALLFVSGKPMKIKALAGLVAASRAEVEEALRTLHTQYAEREAGLQLIFTEDSVQLYTAAAAHELVTGFLDDETQSDLTKPQLETLAIIAYRGPLLKEELEFIRGINCTMILRNLLLRGLVLETQTTNGLQYEVSGDFLAHLGVASVESLPQYQELHQHQQVEDALAMQQEA